MAVMLSWLARAGGQVCIWRCSLWTITQPTVRLPLPHVWRGLACSHLGHMHGPDWPAAVPRTKDGRWLVMKPLRSMLLAGPDALPAGHPCRDNAEVRGALAEVGAALAAQEAAAGGQLDTTFLQV